MQQAVLYRRQETDRLFTLQVVLNNQQVYHRSSTTIDLDVNTYLTIDPKVSAPIWPHISAHTPFSILHNAPIDRPAT